MNQRKKDTENDETFNRYLLWKEYENIAMHFNSLIIKLRSQSLGGVAVFATIAGVVAKGDTTATVRWGLLTGAFALLSVFWLAVWVLDFCYYNRLLAGAVQALIDIERGSVCSPRVKEITYSLTINEFLISKRKRKEESKPQNEALQPTKPRGALYFYIIVFLGLLGALTVCFWRYRVNELRPVTSDHAITKTTTSETH